MTSGIRRSGMRASGRWTIACKQHGRRFDHNLHALRIVEHFEERYAAHRGLNLTLGVREGIVKHSRDYAADASGAGAVFSGSAAADGSAADRPGGRDCVSDGGSG